MSFVKKLMPSWLLKFIRPFYHGSLSMLGSLWFGRPSNELVVIGVTGTNGKSTSVNLIARVLQEAGEKTGYSSTVTVNTGDEEKLNKVKITMPSGWVLNRWLREMVSRGCTYAVVEVSSEGLMQNRHLGINFDVAVFTNLTPEHIQAHGGFENYKLAKAELFKGLGARSKELDGKKILKTIIVNIDDQHADYYKSFKADRYMSFGVKNPADFQAADVSYSPEGIKFTVKDSEFQIQLKGQFDVYNSLAAIATGGSQGVNLEVAKSGLGKITVVPGRVEVIQRQPFTVVVDYAYEPEEMRQLYETVNRWPHQRILQVLGPTGGGRDKARIKILGRMAAEFAAIVVITTDDPYDENPREIIHQMADAAAERGKIIGQNLFRSPDRRTAIAKVFSLAQPGDIVLITGKGADQKMAVSGGNYIDWDDRVVARAELEKISNAK